MYNLPNCLHKSNKPKSFFFSCRPQNTKLHSDSRSLKKGGYHCWYRIGGIWRYLAVFGGIWRYLAVFGGIWRYLAVFGGIWRYLAVFGGIWRYLAVFGGIWRYLAVFGICVFYASCQPSGCIRSSVYISITAINDHK